MRILVVGAGAMGSQIAKVCALAGAPHDRHRPQIDALDRALSQLHARLDREVTNGRRSRDAVDAAAATADIAIEAPSRIQAVCRSPPAATTCAEARLVDELRDHGDVVRDLALLGEVDTRGGRTRGVQPGQR